MKQTLHVVFFNRSYYPDLSATGQLLAELCEELCQHHGCRVTVVAGMPLLPMADRPVRSPEAARGWLVERERRNGVEILRARGTRFPKAGFLGRFCNYVTYFLSACWAGQRLGRPDLVVSLTDPPIIGLAAWLAARRYRTPFVMAVKDVFPEVARLLEDFDSRLVERVLQVVNRFLVRRADRVVALGDTMRRRLIEGKGADPQRTVVIPDWTDCNQIRPHCKDNAFSRQYGLADKFVVMHSGNLGLSQGLEELIEAARSWLPHSEIRLVFVGEGVKKAELQQKAHDLGLTNVLFLPFQPQERLIDSFAAADVFLISLKKGLSGFIVPCKLYGILASGRPYVAAVEADSEVAETTRRHGCGLLADPGDAAAVAECVSRLFQDPALTARLGERARSASFQFDRPRQVDAYRRLFQELQDEWAARPSPTKRSLDILLASAGILLAAPLGALIAAAIKLDDGGAVFHPHRRVGQGGRSFRSWKFRSMHSQAESGGARQAAPNDARITRVGRLLRSTALDELPQLWNILRGDMSFVGPRALLPAEIEVNGSGRVVALRDIPGYRERHRVTPGLTGIAQVFAPRDVPRRQKFRLDLLYIRKRSFWLDLKLILLSFWITFRGRWETRGGKI